MNFGDWVKIQSVVTFLLVLFRVGGIFFAAPLFSNSALPRRLRVAMALMTSLLLLPLVPVKVSDEVLASNILLVILIFKELTIGVILGFSASIAFSFLQMAGELFGMVVGFSMATIFDPANEGSSGVLTSLYVIIGALLFLYLDGHHTVLVALTKSFQILPITEGYELKAGLALGDLIGRIFILAIQAAAPVLVVLTILNIVFGVLTKLSPQMSIYMNTGFILTPIIGIVVLMISLPLFRMLMMRMTENLEPELVHVLKVMKGI